MNKLKTLDFSCLLKMKSGFTINKRASRFCFKDIEDQFRGICQPKS